MQTREPTYAIIQQQSGVQFTVQSAVFAQTHAKLANSSGDNRGLSDIQIATCGSFKVIPEPEPF